MHDEIIKKISVEIEIDKNPVRPNDNRIVTGSNLKLHNATGWKQSISLRDSVKDIINYWYNS